MPFDPDELANGMMRWLEMKNGRKPTPDPADAKPLPEDEYDIPHPGAGGYGDYDPGVIYQNPEPSPPPAEMPGSGLSIEELQDQIKALQDQLKGLQGDGGAQFIPPGPGRDAPELTPDERRKKDWEMFDKWRQGGDGVPQYLRPRRQRPVPMPYPSGDGSRRAPMPKYPPPVPMPTYPRNGRPYIPHPDDDDIIADMPSWGPYKTAPRGGYEYDILRPNPIEQMMPDEKPNWRTLPYIIEENGRQEKPIFENLPYRYKEPMTESPYELLNGTGSPVEGLNLKVGRHGNNYTPSKVTPGKGASLN